MLMHKFNGILDRDNMASGVSITVPQHSRLGGTLTCTGTPNKEDQATTHHGNLFKDGFRQIQLLKGGDM